VDREEDKVKREIDILGVAYKVIQEEDPHNGDGQSVWGLIQYGEQTIRIKKGLPGDVKADTLMHEIVHGVLGRLNYDEAHSEDYVARLGVGLYQALKPYLDFSKVLP
jgi:hypothetical protein